MDTNILSNIDLNSKDTRDRLHLWTLTLKDTKMLSNSKNIDLNGKEISGKTSLMNAYINGHKDVVARYLKAMNGT